MDNDTTTFINQNSYRKPWLKEQQFSEAQLSSMLLKDRGSVASYGIISPAGWEVCPYCKVSREPKRETFATASVFQMFGYVWCGI